MGEPGGYEDEDKQKSPMDDWSKLPSPDDLPTFGQPRRQTPMPPLPDPVHPKHRPEHGGWGETSKQPDEEPLDWRTYVQAADPGKTLAIRNVLPGGQPQAPNQHQDRFDPTMRSMYWRDYSQAAAHVDSMQNMIAPDFNAFMDGENNADLQALGFVIPAGESGDASAFADKQDVSGGTTLASLFNGNGSLNLTKKDQAGMQHAHDAFEKHGTAKPAHDMTVSADHDLKSALHEFEAAKTLVKEADQGVETAKADIERVSLAHLVAKDKEAVEKAKEHAESVQKSIEFVVGGALKYTLAGPEEAIDAVEGIGAMASFAVSKVSGHSIEAAEAVLAQDTEKLEDKEAEIARGNLERAKTKVAARLAQLKAKREAVLAMLGKRKQFYEAAGRASAHASGGDAATQGKMTALMAAIPAAETLVGMVRNIATKCADPGPAYTQMAGSGFAMAVYDASPQATNMVSALGNIAYIRSRFGMLLYQWETRLASLQKARTQLGGRRAEGMDEDLKASIESDKPIKSGGE